MYSVYQHWDPLKLCVVGRSYPPEFYSWIKVPHVRSLLEKIAIETEEDFQNLIQTLERFGVKVVRPTLPHNTFIEGKYQPPPMTPRDYMSMVGSTFYESYTFNLVKSYNSVKDASWPSIAIKEDFYLLPQWIQDECNLVHEFIKYIEFFSCYDEIFDKISLQNNVVKKHFEPFYVSGANMAKIGKDLYFGTETYNDDIENLKELVSQEFSSYRTHVINTGGHSDATYCPVCPGLIISLNDVPTYEKTFPGWEVVYLPNQSWGKIPEFMDLKLRNSGKWWIPGFERDQSVVDIVETWLGHWMGYVEETVFDVNMLILNPKNVVVTNYNKQVFDALERYNITPHIVPFRHRYFWDGGIHCVTADLHRKGSMQDYFPLRV